MNTFKVTSISDIIVGSNGKPSVIVSVQGAEIIRSHKNNKFVGKPASIFLSEKVLTRALKYVQGVNLEQKLGLLLGGIEHCTLVGDISFKKANSTFKDYETGEVRTKDNDGYVINDHLTVKLVLGNDTRQMIINAVFGGSFAATPAAAPVTKAAPKQYSLADLQKLAPEEVTDLLDKYELQLPKSGKISQTIVDMLNKNILELETA